MKARRKEELLQLADVLIGRLGNVPVPALRDVSLRQRGAEVAAVGIPPSCLGQLTSFLAAHSDRGELERFLGLLDQLDPIASQNQQNPKANYAVLKGETQRFLKENPDLTAEECLYVLSWARRLMPSESVAKERPARNGSAVSPSRPKPRTAGELARELRNPDRETWSGATVSYDPGGGGVVRAASGGKTAEARQNDAKLLIERLSPEARERMVERKKRRPVKADVDVERVGRSWRLVAVTERR